MVLQEDASNTSFSTEDPNIITHLFSRDSIHGLLTPLALSASCWCLLSLSPKSVNCRRTSFRASENQQVHVCRVEVADSCPHFLLQYPDTTPIYSRLYHSSFHFLFHYPNSIPINSLLHYRNFHFLFPYPDTTPIYTRI